MRAKSSLWYLAAILLGGGVLAIVIARNLHSSPSPPAVSSGLSEVFTGAGGINAPSGIATNEIVNLSYEVVQAYPHDRKAFTQGLIYLDGIFIESTGLNGQSKLRKVELQTGKVLQEISLPFQYFAEGLAQLGANCFNLPGKMENASFTISIRSNLKRSLLIPERDGVWQPMAIH